MKHLYLLLLIAPFLLSCSSDGDEQEEFDDRIAVTEADILGTWEYVRGTGENEVKYIVYFEPSEQRSLYEIYHNGNRSRFRFFNYTLSGFSMKLEGGAIMGDPSETNIYKQNDKLYFLDMPFTPSINKEY